VALIALMAPADSLGREIGASPGARGIGDPYFPLDGNGGYDVAHYDLYLAYHPATGVLVGAARVVARATEGLSAFNLDFDGMRVASIRVGGQEAKGWARSRGELTVRPAAPIADRAFFVTVALPGGASRAFLQRQRIGLCPHRGRGACGRRAARRVDLVPGQRPSVRQGHLHLPRPSSAGPAGGG